MPATKRIRIVELVNSKYMSSYNSQRHSKRLFWLCIIGISCFGVAIVWNYLRRPPHLASYNIGFNFGIYFPLLFLSTIILYIVAGQTILNWTRMKEWRIKTFNLILSLTVLALICITFINMARLS